MHEHRDRGIADADDLAAMDEVAGKADSCEKILDDNVNGQNSRQFQMRTEAPN